MTRAAAGRRLAARSGHSRATREWRIQQRTDRRGALEFRRIRGADTAVVARDRRQYPGMISPARLALVVSLAPLPLLAQTATTPHDAHRLHADPKAYVAALEDPERDAYQKPDEVLQALDLKAGQHVADIGAGSGYFTLRLAHHVGPTGRVHAVDVSPDMIAHIDRRVAAAGLRNVRTTLAPPDDPRLPDASIDLVFVCDVWHHIENQTAYLAKLRRALKPGGRLAMLDFHKRELPVGPPAEMKIAREELLAQMERARFRVTAEHTFLPYQYFLVFTPAP